MKGYGLAILDWLAVKLIGGDVVRCWMSSLRGYRLTVVRGLSEGW